MSFLSKRPHPEKCNEGEYNKLHRVDYYMHATMNLGAIIVIEDIGTLMTFVDASLAAHDNMRGHTELAIMFGIGAFMSESKT